MYERVAFSWSIEFGRLIRILAVVLDFNEYLLYYEKFDAEIFRTCTLVTALIIYWARI